jgi:hypothetical protein
LKNHIPNQLLSVLSPTDLEDYPEEEEYYAEYEEEPLLIHLKSPSQDPQAQKSHLAPTTTTPSTPRIHNPIPLGCLLTVPIFHPISSRNHLACLLSLPGTPNLYK